MLLAFADTAFPGKRSEQRFVRLAVERRELEPPFQVREGLVLGSTLREMLEDRGMAAAEAATLRGEPSAESRVAVDLEALEQLAPVSRRARAPRTSLRSLTSRSGDLERVDGAAGKPSATVSSWVRTRLRLPSRILRSLSRTAQLAARIVRHIPQQLAKLAPQHRKRRQNEVGEQRPHLARGGQRDRLAPTAHAQGAEHAQLHALLFHAQFHAGYHARPLA
jgi:hypothetical protein